MATMDLTQQSNPFIKEQQQLFQRFHAIRESYENGKREAEESLKRDTEAVEANWGRAKKDTEAEIEQIRQVLNTARGTITSAMWDRKVRLEVSRPLLPPPAVPDLNQEIARCRTLAFDTNQSIASLIQANPDPSKNSSKWGWIAASLGCLSWVVIGAILSSIFSAASGDYNGGGGFTLGFFLALAIGLVIYGTQVGTVSNRLQSAYDTLSSAVFSAEVLFRQRLKGPEEIYRRNLTQVKGRYSEVMRQNELRYRQNLDRLLPGFTTFENATSSIEFLNESWTNEKRWQQWTPRKTAMLSPAVRLGTLAPEIEPRVAPLPVFAACPGNQNLLFKASGEGKDAASAVIRSIMLRLLATLPPGKVHFTLIDPVGLGKNVEIFMQLADEEYDKRLVNSRAWTDQRHIEQRLADLSEEIVNIGQKYLRGQFKTIEDYNKQAGEVEEPYRVLIVIGFPDRFTDETAKTLIKVAENGPKCGVSTIIMMDTEMPQPYGFSLDDLERISTVFEWESGIGRFVWKNQDFQDSVLRLDMPPSVETFNRILAGVGAGAKKASEVKVQFERVAPPEEKWWSNEEWWKTGTSPLNGQPLDGIGVPLGRIGATRLQLLEMGRQNSTAHHALIAGKTGSGKTTLLHVLITNLALTYSPDEIELYLVDFKTVGFTPYTMYRLPHVRVVAIQSEREFGLSVLRRLDTELVRRKERFSKIGVADLYHYRKERPGERMPRILLLVDEFQEFFTEDDEISRNAAVFLERLVRQGRGLGIHIMLGSQSLSGTASLPIATLGQMDIRIAMRCEEKDARLILSDDNPAARLLSRPGEAIYNASNGLEAGNSRFQSAWLSDGELKSYLERIQRFTRRPDKQKYISTDEPIIFDGNANADVRLNKSLKRIISMPTWSAPQRAVSAWLGEPIEIKDSTVIQLRPQAGQNFLIVGQQEETALGMLATSLISLTAQHAPGTARFYIVDYTLVDAPHAGFLQHLAGLLPHDIKVVDRRGLLRVVGEIHKEVQERMGADGGRQIPIYLFIYGLQRARDIRPDDSFGFPAFGSTEEEKPNSAKQFATILREGPDVGVHTLTWIDTLNNLNRSVERGTLREFEMRAVFQMSTEDSMTLIDVPAASKLGPYRAILFSEETGRVEKFRPYDVPDMPWLQQVSAQLGGKR